MSGKRFLKKQIKLTSQNNGPTAGSVTTKIVPRAKTGSVRYLSGNDKSPAET